MPADGTSSGASPEVALGLIKWTVLAFCLFLIVPAQAQESAAERACDALPGAAQSGCVEKLAQAADAKLNEAYRSAVKAIETSDSKDKTAWKAALKKGQQAWIAFRDADCGDLIGYEWGEGTGMGSAVESCILQKTEARTRDLVNRYIERR
jgi:uncharacterized protein YecT (DUF1311 family)